MFLVKKRKFLLIW